ncbi:hypothetical protein JVT61DRAFT_6060 [Boletus reticuloceps]|uniref:Uncharacterized protein n=1 Tax=Boletus reticuloceps TaxID=495285 RepID=A0A8I2YLL5_9AGAM|nr:hypothetical protein JVT61DRAFT_6060 [Boletus reticuloceps]
MNGSKRKLDDCDALATDGVESAGTARGRKTSKLAQDGNTVNTENKSQNDSPDSSPGLAPLLDFSALTSAEEISEHFEVVARELLSNTILCVVQNGICTDLDILELEFYLQKACCHEDPFTHGSVEQERSGQWYFHRSPRRADTRARGLPVTAAGSYRGGTRKGLDLTIGGPVVIQTSNAPVTMRGGALLRTVRHRTDNKVICGPSLLVDEILRLSGASTIDHLVNRTWNGDIFALSPPTPPRGTFMYLRRATQNPLDGKRPTVYRSPRIGLDLSNPDTTGSITHPRVVFVGKPYRYFTHPGLLAYKGRVQTFVGLYNMLIESKGYAEDSMELKKALRDLLGLGEQNVSKYMADYRSGYQGGKLKSFTGRAGKGVCQSASEYLRMMGALRKALQ